MTLPARIPFVDLHAQYLSIQGEIDAAIAGVLAETAFIGGRHVRAFEESFASFVGRRHCIGCANGTDSLEILLQALGIGPGDEVIVPANSWISTSEAVSAVGALPVFADSLPGLYTIDVGHAARLVTPRTRAIIPVHLYGLPADMDAVMELAGRHGLKVVEDCAQAHGATYRGRCVGSIGDAGSFSFYPGKNLGAYGDAGCMVTDDDELATRARMLANHGRLGKHDHALEGRNSRLDGLQAAILLAKLPHLPAWTEARRSRAAHYRERLAGCRVELPREPAGSTHVYHLFVVQLEGRDRVREALCQDAIETGIHYPIPLPLLKAYAARGFTPGDFPVAAPQAGRILSLPIFPELAEEQIDRICARLSSLTQG
jgi:dTDP-4-amino-4,6-dideoxygalactose transaminase